MPNDPGPSTPEAYIAGLEEPRRSEVARLHELVRQEAPTLYVRMEGGGIAYGHYRYRYASGREGEWYPIALVSRKQYISFYLSAATPEHGYIAERYKDKLPKADIGRACIRIKHLSDIDLDVIAEMVRLAAKDDGVTIGPTDRSTDRPRP